MRASTPLATEAIRLSVPARREFVHLLRSVTAAAASHLALSVDDVDDLRLAVDEACARLLSLPGEPRTIRLELRPLPGRVEVLLGVDATATWPSGGLQDTLAWRVLGALADHVRFELWNGSPAVRIVKRTLEGGR